jgi:PD-(D/E)XK nuclease superfamily protein
LTGERRVDIFLHASEPAGFGIVIENKLWARDQEGQLADYACWLERTYPQGWRLVYLSIQGEPTSLTPERRKQLVESEHLVEIRYTGAHSIVEWLEESHQSCRAERVRVLRHLTFKR